MRSLGHSANVWLTYKKLPKCFPEWLYHFTIQPAINKRSRCSESLKALGIVSIVHILLLLLCISLMVGDVKCIFICLFDIFISPWYNICSFAHFQIGLLVLLPLCLEFFMYFGCKSFIGYATCKHFLPVCGLSFFFLRFYLFIFRERGRKGEEQQCVVASHAPPTGDLACNPGMCPVWESNW